MANNFADFVVVMAIPWGAIMLCTIPIAILEWLEERQERSWKRFAAGAEDERPLQRLP